MSGVCLVTSLTAAEIDGDRYRKNPPLQLKAHPLANLPRFPKPVYHDPAKDRPLDVILASLRKQADSVETWTKNRIAAAVGQTTIPGWRMVFSDGCFCVSEPGPSTNTQYPREFVRGERIELGRLPAAAWRAYAPVRPFTNERSGAIRWTFTADRVTFFANGQPDLGEGSSWHPGSFADSVITLADGYLWPCRGREWDLARVGEAILLTDLEATTQIVIMGMRV